MTGRQSIWTWRTCAAIAAGTVATMIAAATGLLTLEHLVGLDWDAAIAIFSEG